MENKVRCKCGKQADAIHIIPDAGSPRRVEGSCKDHDLETYWFSIDDYLDFEAPHPTRSHLWEKIAGARIVAAVDQLIVNGGVSVEVAPNPKPPSDENSDSIFESASS